MEWTETRVLKEVWDVERRLRELGLDRTKLLRVRDVALAEAANATPYHCANAAGTFAYQLGTWALRNEFAGSGWRADRTDGVETIIHDGLKIRVGFQNVDVACDDEEQPKPRSSKGPGSERICVANLFGNLPHFAPRKTSLNTMYYIMVDQNGAAELTLAVVSGGTFTSFLERLYLSDGSDFSGERTSLFDNDDAATDFDPLVIRK